MKQKLETVCISALFAVGVFSVVHGLSLPLMGPVATSPGLFPVTVGGILAALCGGFLIRLRLRTSSVNSGSGPEEGARESGDRPGDAASPPPVVNNLGIVIGMLFAYIVLLPLIHFIPASLVFGIGLTGYALRKISIRTAAAVTGTVLAVYLAFTLVFHVIMP